MERELNRLKAPLGVWFAYGNHDYMSGIDECAAFIREKTDIHILCDTVVTLPNGLQLLGRDDRRSPRRRSADEFLRCIDPEKPLVIIDHQPVELHEAKQLGATLQFSGHTHHGQVIPLSWLTDLLFDLSYGFAVRDNVNYYVSSGLSLWGPPFRIGTECEFVIFEAK
jgi:predicted MPP superfamily phosphohydrolase